MRRNKSDTLETRNAIIRAAEAIFYCQGVAESSLSDVAKKAGVTRGAIYWHFAGRSDLLQELSIAFLKPRYAILAHCKENLETDDPIGILEQAIARWFSQIDADAHLQRVLAIFQHASFLRNYCDVVEAIDRLRSCEADILDALFRRAKMLGQLKDCYSVAFYTTTLRSLVNGVLNDWLCSDKSIPLSEIGMYCVREVTCSFRIAHQRST